MAIASDKMVFYYMARDNLCFLTLCEDAYPKRLAFLYLDEIADIILNELQREYGTNVSVVRFVVENALFCVPINIGIMGPSPSMFSEMRITILSMNLLS
jgi:Regulated-SNARE-like domain